MKGGSTLAAVGFAQAAALPCLEPHAQSPISTGGALRAHKDWGAQFSAPHLLALSCKVPEGIIVHHEQSSASLTMVQNFLPRGRPVLGMTHRLSVNFPLHLPRPAGLRSQAFLESPKPAEMHSCPLGLPQS